ncbi:programmed cell death protein 7 isoform X2 [Strongylocentrotus purpuratus]|uniref:Programmed cell death 7 n=1 Tax=Strongylocentrotus purpuratus TaxID=7668 RepID=A0A7M7N988_STRPU|nr:programmed cell death protein 7 isoform X2 [Strongylocentrotus purpuratus]
MSSSPWGAPPPAKDQRQPFFPSGQSRPPFPPYMNQGAPSNQCQNQSSNAPSYTHFPPAPSASMAPPNAGVGHGFHPPPQPPRFPSVPPPLPHGNQFGGSGQTPRMTLPPPPFPVPPQQQQHPGSDGGYQPVSNMMFNPSLPQTALQPPNEWSTNSSLAGQGHGQWNHRRMENNYQLQNMNNSTQNKFTPYPQQASRRHIHGDSNSGQTRLQPYQSFRSKQAEGSHHNSFPGKTKMAPGGDGLRIADLKQSMTTEVDQPEKAESEDQKWVNQWSKSLKRGDVSKEATKPILKISEARILLFNFLHLLDQLKKKREEASDSLMKETDESKWSYLCKEMDKQAEDLSKLESRISQPEFIEGLKSQIEKKRRKRERYKRHRLGEWEMGEEALRKRNDKIDASMAAALHAKQEKEQEEVLQKEVDQVLSEVHKKKQDANKTMELFRALRKLRQLRKESAEKGGYKAPRVLDERFNKKMSVLEEMMNKQKLLYIEEEKALQVMLEEEHEETREKARQKKELKERQKAERAWEEQLELLFGKTEELELGHPLFMFRQFHQQASHDLQSLTNIRCQWDMFVVPESDRAGSSIPVSWVMPSDPLNHIWATAMVDSSGT